MFSLCCFPTSWVVTVCDTVSEGNVEVIYQNGETGSDVMPWTFRAMPRYNHQRERQRETEREREIPDVQAFILQTHTHTHTHTHM